MLRVLRTFAVPVLLSACSAGSRGAGAPNPAHTPAVEPAAPPPGELAADYQCRFGRADAPGPTLVCSIRADRSGSLHLVQGHGGFRLSGTVTPDEAGFRFSGEIHCSTPTECPAPGTRDILFFVQRPGAYAAVVPLPDGQLLDIGLTRR